MTDVFISYRRKPSSSLAQLIKEKLENQYHIDAYLDVERADSTKIQFPDRLMNAIANSPTFICLLADITLESDWVRKEILQAYQLKKHCIPVFQETYEPVNTDDASINYLLSFDGIKLLDISNVYIDEGIAKLYKLIQKKNKLNVKLFVATFIVLIFCFFILFVSNNLSTLNYANLQITVPIDKTITDVLPSSNNSTPDILALLAQTQTFEIQLSMTIPTYTPTMTPNYDKTLNYLASQTAVFRPTYTPTFTHTPRPGDVASNIDWQPIEMEFNGISMVLVPNGCFDMGSNSDFMRDENPIHEQCFDKPFWIDKYEITNEQFYQLGGLAQEDSRWTEDDLPRETITWFEARDFCELRGGRLPTEVEWEYAARGPDNLIYTWGNNFESDNVAHAFNYRYTAYVGSFPNDRSWVGAFDMSGNVSEWTNSLYKPYPYQKDDGREVDNNNNENLLHVIRGGDFTIYSELALTGSYRYHGNSVNSSRSWGFRCVRDY